MNAKPMIKTINLCKTYQDRQIIHMLSIEVKCKENTSIFAPSGAGKSTLIRLLTGLEPASSGSILVDDPMPSVIFQEPRLFPYMTVEENIRLPWIIRKNPWTQNTQRDYLEWLEVCELTPWKNHYPYQLSGGMRQKTSLIRGFLGSPALALLDEPFQSIGYDAKINIIEHIKTRYPDITLLLVTHNLEEIPMLTNQVYFFEENRLASPLKLNADQFQTLFSTRSIPTAELTTGK